MRFKTGASIGTLVLAASGALSTVCAAQTAPASPADTSTVVVTGSRVRSLEQFTPTGSRLNLTPKDTPATLDVIDAQTIETRGYLTAEEAADSLPGVTSGATPGDLSDFHIRGFSDTQISQLHNGLYVGPSDMVARPQNTFNLQSVEILKGPASVLYGQGAIGGAVNFVNKAPIFGPMRGDAMAAYGSFNTAAFGVGATGSVNETTAVRLDVSRVSSDGYVDRAPNDSFNVTASILWKPTPKLDVQLLVDYLQDHPSPYYGTPLVPTAFATDPLKGVISTTYGYTLDKRTQFVNYNVGDYGIESHQIWPQLYIKYKLSDDIVLNNFLYYIQADRRWKNAETYLFDPATNLINRDRFFVDHNQFLIGDQADATISTPIFGLQNKLNIGLDYSHLDFKRTRGFPDNDEVDPFNPSPGLFGDRTPPGTVARVSPTYWDDPAVFFEDILSLTSSLKLVTGFRYDYLSLVRQNFGPDGSFQGGSSFSRVYQPTTYRVGVVYDVNKFITPYISYTTGQDPVGSNIFLVNASQNFSLGKSNQIEAGVKANAPDNRAEITLAVYDINRHNVLTTNGADAVVPVGSESSRGVEISGDVRITQQWNLNANLSYDEAKYGTFTFVDAVTGDTVVANGNRLPGAPKWISNIWTSYTGVLGLPLELGGGLKYVGDEMGDYGNTEKLHAYTTLNMYATYSITPKVDVSFRVDNIADTSYGVVDVNYERQVILGRPRYFQVDVRAHF
jgi:iron complex outermembrane receptor protein